jgi:hypothetical protein
LGSYGERNTNEGAMKAGLGELLGERYTIGLESLGTRYRKYRNDGAKGREIGLGELWG